MFVFSKADGNDFQIDQFEITGSTYEPKGDILFNGSKFISSDRSGLVELAECAALCNDSALDYNDVSDISCLCRRRNEGLVFHLIDEEGV